MITPLWVSNGWFQQEFNSENPFQGLQQLIKFSGIDISEIFNSREKHKLEMFDVKSQNEYGKAKNLFWWNDPTYIIGGVTSQERQVCIYVKTKG